MRRGSIRSTSELYGLRQETSQETTPFYPRPPYGVAKLYGCRITVNYREANDVCLERHPVQSREPDPRRDLVTGKITRGITRIETGLEEALHSEISRRSATGAMPGIR